MNEKRKILIRRKLEDEGFPQKFIKEVMNFSLQYEGLYNLLEMWYEEIDEYEKELTLEAIKDIMIDIKFKR